MGQFAAAIPLIAQGVSAVTGLSGSAEQKEGERAELDRQAELEKIAAKDRSIERRRRLNTVLAGQIAATGASGIAFEGTPQAVAKGDIRQFELEEAGAKLSDLERIAQLRRASRAARKSAQRSRRLGSILVPGPTGALGVIKDVRTINK